MTPINTSLLVLVIVSTIIILVLGVLLIRLVLNITTLTESMSEIAKSVQNEVEPTLKELKEAAKSINSIANNADVQFSGAQNTIKSVLGASSLIGEKMKGLFGGLLKGISFGFNLFNKK